MIRIENGTSKEVILTLSESSTLLTSTYSPYYIFYIENNNGDDIVFTNSDNSNSIVRYNSFTFSNNLNISNMNGGFTCSNGMYNYKVYETEHNNLIIGRATGIVETGIIEIYGNSVEPFGFSSNNDDEFRFTY